MTGRSPSGSGAKGVPALIFVLGPGNADGDQQEQALESLLKIAVNKANLASIYLAGAIPILINLLGASPKLSAQAAGVLACLATAHEYSTQIADAGAIGKLTWLLVPTASEVAQKYYTAALGNLAGIDANRRKMVSSGTIPALVSMLGPGATAAVQKNACMALYVLSSSSEAKAHILAGGAVANLTKLAATSPNSDVRREATDALSMLSVKAVAKR